MPLLDTGEYRKLAKRFTYLAKSIHKVVDKLEQAGIQQTDIHSNRLQKNLAMTEARIKGFRKTVELLVDRKNRQG